jgi:GGDEF domain-containing protein
MSGTQKGTGAGHALHMCEGEAAEALVADTLLRLCERLTVTLDIWESSVYEYDPERDCLIDQAIWSRNLEQRDIDWIGTENRINRHRGIERVFSAHEVVVVHAENESNGTPEFERMDYWGEKTALYAPLELDGEILGLLELIERRNRRDFSDDELHLVGTLADIAAIAIGSARASRREARRNERLVNLLDISRTLTSSLKADDVIEGVRSRVGSLFPERATVVDVMHPSGDDDGELRATPQRDRLVARALMGLQPEQELAGGCQRLVVPLIAQGRAESWINIVGEEPLTFDEDELELVQILANQAAAALDNTRLYETLAQQAITDGLTGLYNHRFFYERLRDEVARAKRYGLPMSLLMMDLDDFKHYNDSFGHPAGDGVLRRVAEVMRSQLRKKLDIPARYGGEEFAVILPHTPSCGAEIIGAGLSDAPLADGCDLAGPEGAAAAGERVRSSIEQTAFPGAVPSHSTHVTISVGIASVPVHATTAHDLVDAADRALYAAKQLGKNRVEICS